MNVIQNIDWLFKYILQESAILRFLTQIYPEFANGH